MKTFLAHAGIHCVDTHVYVPSLAPVKKRTFFRNAYRDKLWPMRFPHSNSYPREAESQTYDNLTFIRHPPSLILPQSMLW